MAEKFQVYIDGVIGKIDDTSLQQWRKKNAQVAIKMTTANVTGTEQIGKATLQYKNNLDQIVTAQYALSKAKLDDLKNQKDLNKWSNAQYSQEVAKLKLELQSSKTTTDKLAREKELTREKQKQLSIQEKGVVAAKQFLAKKDSYKQTPETAQATDISNRILELSSSITSRSRPSAVKSKTAEIAQLTTQLKQLRAGFTEVEHGAQSFGDKFNQAAVRMAMYAATTQLMYKALQELRAGLQYVVDLNKEMTDIQIVTGFDSEKIDALSHSYNQMAKELGATTLEVARGSLAWFRQGKTIEEASRLTEASIKMSKLANIDSAQSTEYLTSMINGFKLETEDVMGVIDKLVAVDNTAATSVEELASAMQRSSAVAQQSGVSFNELVAYIGTVSSVTRRSATTVGEAFKTMLTRMADIQTGALDESGMSINNVEKALRGVGIELRDSDTSFRQFSDVIEDVATKWDTLNEIEQSNIAKAIAGVRQRETFLVLMENFKNTSKDRVSVEKLLETQLDATGLANERYAIYLDNLEAAQNRAKASWEGLWDATIKSDAVKWFYDLSASMMDNITNMGGLIPVVTALAGAFLMFKSVGFAEFAMTLPMFSNGIVGLGVALKGLSLSAIATLNPLTLMIGALTLAATAIFAYNQNITKNVKAGQMAVAEAVDAKIIKLKQEEATVKEIMDAYNQSIEATKKGGAWAETFMGNDLKEMRLGILKDYLKLLEDASITQEEYAKATKEAVEANGLMVDSTGRVYKEISTSRGVYKQYIEDIYVLTDAMRKAYASVDSDERKVDIISEEELKAIREAGDGFKNIYKGIGSVVEELNNQFADLNDLMQKSIEGTLSFDDIEKLPQDYVDALIVENGQIKLNINLLKEEQIVQAQLALDKVKAAYDNQEATLDEVRLMEMKLQMLRDDAAQTHGIFEQSAWNYQNLIWQIANQASAAGEEVFFDLQGNALNSAQAIFDFMSQSDANFMSLVTQYAKAVGISVAQAMQSIGTYVNAVYNDGVNKMNTLLNYAGYGAGMSYATGDLKYQQQAQSPKPSAPLPGIKPSSFGGFGGGGGGGGGTSQSKEDKQADRAREIQEGIDEERRRAIENLKHQLDLYKDIIDARKDLLDTLADERQYQQDVEDKQADILKIQNELAALAYDQSAEGQARRLELESQLSDKQQELEDVQYDQSIERQKAALDASYEAFATRMNEAIRLIENIEAGSVGDFTGQLSSILSQLSTTTGIPTFHSGAGKGVVSGGNSSGEVFAKLMEGEVVSNESQMRNFMNKTLPSLAGVSSSNNTSSGLSFDKLFDLVVQGNLDSSVLPKIEEISRKVVEQLNSGLLSRGIIRNTNITRI